MLKYGWKLCQLAALTYLWKILAIGRFDYDDFIWRELLLMCPCPNTSCNSSLPSISPLLLWNFCCKQAFSISFLCDTFIFHILLLNLISYFCQMHPLLSPSWFASSIGIIENSLYLLKSANFIDRFLLVKLFLITFIFNFSLKSFVFSMKLWFLFLGRKCCHLLFFY